jgi:hypothetical protein
MRVLCRNFLPFEDCLLIQVMSPCCCPPPLPPIPPPPPHPPRQVISVEPPAFMDLTVVETPPGVKGNTASGSE